MSLSKRKYSSGSLRTLPCGSILRADVKISLFTDDASGWLCAAGLYSRDLQVESGDFLDNFERAVLTVRDASESSVSDNEIAFGQCIKLWHEYSQTWVCVNKRVQSESEKSCCRVCLAPAEEIDDDIIVKFRILPKYKIRSEGEKVKIMDQITLMPFGWEDCRYLHVAKASLDHNRPTIFEANCAYTPTGWAVLNYDDCPATKGTVRLGQPVVLFNAEIEAFLTCDGMDFDFSEQGSALSRVTEAVVVMDSLEDSYKAAASPTQCTVATDATTHTGQAGNHTSDGRQDSCVVFEEADGERSFVRRIPVGSRHYYSTRFANNTHASLGAKSSPGIFESSADTFDKSLTLPDSVAGELATQLASELGHSPYATNLNGSGDFFFGSPTHSQQQNGATVQDDSQLIAKVMERIPANEKPGQKPAEQRTVYLLQMEGSGHRHILEPMRMATTSLWIVENPNPARGGPVLFNVLYNLKHVATNKYLVVLQEEGRYKFALSSSKKPRKEESLFVFQPIDEGQSHVKNAESCFRILHAGSDLCLHFLLNNTSNFAQKRGDRTIISVGLSTVAYYEDVYTCRPVPSTDLLSQLNFVLFNYSHLVAYINAFWHHQVEYRSFAMGKVISNARMSLSRLILFCSDGPEGSNPLTHNGRPLKHRQQLLLDQNVHRVVMEVLQCPFQAPPGRPGERPLVDAKQIHAPEHRAVQLMCILGYKLLKAMVEGRPPFAMELSRFIPFMQTQLPHGFRVADTLMAIFKDNRVLLEGMDEEVLTCFVSLSHLKGKQAQYIKFLCALCECEGVGIRRNQRTIATSILQKSPELLLRMKVDTGRVLVKVPLSHEYHVLQEHSELDLVGSYADEKAVTRPKTPTHGRFKAMVTKLCNARSLLGNAANLARLSSIQDLGLVRDKWYPIDEFCSRVLPTVSDYLEVSLSLFSKLCVSHNRHTKPLVRKIVGKDMVVNVLGHRSRHKALPDRFKREFYQIATNVYLDKPMLYQWNLRNSIKLWSRLKPRTAGPDEQLNNNANDLFLKEIKLASVQLLKENTVLVSTQRERNSLLKAVLQMWEVLIRNRQYSAAEVDLLLPILLDLLDGRTDQEGQLPSPGGTLASPYRRPSTPAAVGVSVSTARPSKRYDLDSAKQAPPTWDNYERYQPTDANVIIMDCKAEVLKILETLMDQYVDDCVEELLTMFKNCFKDLMPTPSPSFSGRQASWMSEMSHANELELIDFPVEQLVQNLMPQLAAYLSEKSFDGSEGMGADGALNRTLRAMGNILSNTRLQARRHEPHGLSSLKEVFTVHRLCPILLDLLLYKDPTVMSKSLSLLYRVFSLKAEVGKVVQEQQLLFDMESETTFHNVCDSARRLYSCLDASPITPKVEEGIGLLSSYFSYLLEPWDTNGHGLTHHPATYFSRMFRGFSSPLHSPTRRETSQSYQSYLPLASGQCSPRPGLRALPYMSFIPPDPLPRNLAFSAFVAAVAERQKQSLEAQVSPMHFDLHVQESSPPSRGGVVSPDGRREARSRSRSPNSCGNSHTASTCSSAPQGADSKATTAGTAGGRPSAAATLSPSSSSRRQLSTDPEKLFLEPTLGLSRANTVEVVSMGSPGDSPVRVHSSDKSPFLSLPGPSSRNATPQKDRDDGPRLVSPELLDDIIEGHGIWATDASDGPHRPRRSSNESGTKQKKTEPKPAASSSALRRAASSAAHAALHTLDLKAMLDRQHSMQSDFPSPGRPHISVSVASLKRADTTLVPRHTPSSARLMKVRHLSVDLLGLQQEGGTSPCSGGSCLSDMDRFNRNVSFGAENATDSSDDDEGPLSGEGSDDEEAALIGRFNYVAVNQEIMRNVGVHTLILRTLRLPFTGRKQERRRQAFIECYRFLIFFCNNNARNQEVVFSPENCSIFLKHIPLDVGADKAIHQLFQNNYRLCSQVREDVVNSVVMLLSHDDDGAHLRFIKGLVVVNGSIPVPRNQTMVMNNLVTQYGDLIQTNQAVDGDLDRHVLRRIVAIVDIMAACCVGLNRATEGPARTMIPIRPLLKTLCEEHAPLPLVMQVPYMTFLREVYWVQDTDEPIALQQIQFWLTDGDWWAAVGLMQDIVLRFMVNELGDVPVEDYITYIFDGVLPCLSDYLRMFWDQFTEADAEHLRAIKTIVAELCKLPSVPVPEMTLVHWDMLKSFLEICQEVTVVQEPLQEHIAACEGQLCTPNQAPSVRLFTLIQRGLTSLQEACLKQFKLDSVDDMPTFTELICDHLKDQNEDLILRTLVEQMKRGSNLTQRVKVITLRFFTQLLIRSRLTSTTRLSPMQVKMSDPQQLAIVPLMSLLAEGEDEAVAYEAVDFGTHLLEGGNALAQGALLQWFQNPDVRLITSMCYKLRKSIQVLRERKAEKLILEENGTNEDRANFRQMLASKREINEMPVVLRLLQLFCEGHHMQMQNYVRQQIGNPHSINTVSEVLLFLREVLLTGIDETTVMMARQAFDTLTEFCQGPCALNQATLMDLTPNVCNEANQVLSPEFDRCSIPEALAFELRGKAVLTLLSLLEGGHHRRTVGQMTHSLSFEAMRHTLDRMWKIVEPTMSDTLITGDMEALDMAFNMYILLCSLHRERDGEACGACEVLRDFQGEACFRTLLGVVEIARDGMVERVLFRKPDCFRMLSQEARDRVLITVDRESPHRKLADFFEQANHIIFEMEYHAYLQSALQGFMPPVPVYDNPLYQKYLYDWLLKVRMSLVALPRTSVGLWHYCTGVVAIVTNVVVCTLTYYEDEDFQLSIHHGSHMILQAVLNLCSSLMLLLNLTTCMSLVVFTMPVLIHKAEAEKRAHAEAQPTLAQNISAVFSLHYYDFCLVVFTLLGIFVSPMFFSIHLLSVIQQSVLLRSVVRAVTLNGRSLLLTGLLCVIVVYLFTIVAFVTFREDFVDATGTHYCDNLIECFIFSINNGIRAGGGLGELLASRRWGQELYASRILFDSAYFVVVIVCLLNIVFGIIIDTFAELRDQRQKIEADTKARCFICGISSSTFDRFVEGGFREHVLNQHNMWQYLYFMLHLRHKPEAEYTGQESYVQAKIRQKDISFFPLNRSLELDVLERDTGSQPDVTPVEVTAVDVPASSAGLLEIERRLQAKIEESSKEMQHRLEGVETAVQHMEKSLQIMMAKVTALCEAQNATGKGGENLYNLSSRFSTHAAIPRRASQLLTTMNIDIPYVGQPGRTGVAAAAARCPSPSALSLSGGPSSPPHNTVVSPVNRLSPGPDARG